MSTEDEESKKPIESPFHQQTLQAWKPFILMSNVFPYFATIGTAFILIGVLLLIMSLSVKELPLDYTNCNRSNSNNMTNEMCSSVINSNATSNFETCICTVPFQIYEPFIGQVYLYYSIKNFYQNHRRYVMSKDDYQLSGRYLEKVTTDCNPFGFIENGSNIYNYAPCGLIANSLFNDTFQINYIVNDTVYPVPMTTKGIAWSVDTNVLYGKPNSWNKTLKPVNWLSTAQERNKDSYNGDEELLVWMRAAPFSTFKKLNRIIKHDQYPFKNGLPVGQYQLTINYAYPVTIFNGRKLMVLSTTSGIGGKNHNMGILYIVVGAIQLIIAMAFAISTFVNRDKSEFGKKEFKLGTLKTSCSDMPLIACQSNHDRYGVADQ